MVNGYILKIRQSTTLLAYTALDICLIEFKAHQRASLSIVVMR